MALVSEGSRETFGNIADSVCSLEFLTDITLPEKSLRQLTQTQPFMGHQTYRGAGVAPHPVTPQTINSQTLSSSYQ